MIQNNRIDNSLLVLAVLVGHISSDVRYFLGCLSLAVGTVQRVWSRDDQSDIVNATRNSVRRPSSRRVLGLKSRTCSD